MSTFSCFAPATAGRNGVPSAGRWQSSTATSWMRCTGWGSMSASRSSRQRCRIRFPFRRTAFTRPMTSRTQAVSSRAVDGRLVMKEHRARFRGRTTPVHFFWGTFDLALTRYSGRLVEPLPGAIRHFGSDAELICAGWWPGDHRMASPAFFGYAYPSPEGVDQVEAQPAGAAWNSTAGEFLFPYEAALSSADPRRAIREFLETTYKGAAKRMGWSSELTAFEEPTPGSDKYDPRRPT